MLPLNYNLPRTYFELAHIVESIHGKDYENKSCK